MAVTVFRDDKPFACALDALERGDFADADAAISALLDAQGLALDDRAFLLNKRGVARIRLERREAAHADFEAALQIKPRFAPALTNLGNLALEAGDVEAAIARYRRAVDSDPEYAIAYLNLSVAYKRSGRIADGVRALRQAQRIEQRAIAGSWRRARRR
jgi:tetratricopeptide (TPR) repeat protein